ncbi:MAG: GntR family transcriptional regulator [Oricola sp.]|jgi:DNA-binding GntR family transcriptional regulator|nr:GntR family transcriptional regulator [Oricola sp.]
MLQTQSRRQTGRASSASVYDRIKTRLVRHEFPAGCRISIEPLAEALFVSATPVREALTRLAVEKMVHEVPNAGFFTKPQSQSELADLYDLQELLLDWSAAKAASRAEGPALLKPPRYCDDYQRAAASPSERLADVADNLFLHLARQSGNTEVIRMIDNLNARTNFARQNCFKLFGDPGNHFQAVCGAYSSLDFNTVRPNITLYFDGLRTRLPSLFRSMARSSILTSP